MSNLANRLETNDVEAAQRFQWNGYWISSLIFVVVISALLAYEVMQG